MTLECQGNSNHNIYGIRLDYDSEIVQEYGLGYKGDFK